MFPAQPVCFRSKITLQVQHYALYGVRSGYGLLSGLCVCRARFSTTPYSRHAARLRLSFHSTILNSLPALLCRTSHYFAASTTLLCRHEDLTTSRIELAGGAVARDSTIASFRCLSWRRKQPASRTSNLEMNTSEPSTLRGFEHDPVNSAFGAHEREELKHTPHAAEIGVSHEAAEVAGR